MTFGSRKSHFTPGRDEFGVQLLRMLVRYDGQLAAARVWLARCDDAELLRAELAGRITSMSKSMSMRKRTQDVDLRRCPECAALMRPGVVWFGEQLPWNELQRVENYLDGGTCDLVIVAGTTATFGYIIDWALQASHGGGELIEVNPEETPLSQFATRLVREPAAIALPKLVEEVTASSPQI